jgi:fumarate reductase flavoprotein subunit
VPLSLVDSFLYPGHSVMRMHGSPNRTGSELMGALAAACERRGIDILTEAQVTELFADRGTGLVHGARLRRPDGSTEDLGCDALVLACCGFAGNDAMVRQYIPEIEGATFFGHPGNKGDAIRWGLALGAAVRDIHSYQGHGGLAAGRGIPILWPLIMEGGFQVNAHGRRFSNEARGYSEQAVDVVAQPGHVAWDIYDARLHAADARVRRLPRCRRGARDPHGRQFVAELAVLAGIDAAGLATDRAPRSRDWCERRARCLGPAFRRQAAARCAVPRGQGHGRAVPHPGRARRRCDGRVLREDGSALPNLFAGGGAARGISGPSSWGYMAGNGLLTATTLRPARRQRGGAPGGDRPLGAGARPAESRWYRRILAGIAQGSPDPTDGSGGRTT